MRKKEKNAWVPETEIGFCIFKSSLKMDSVQTVSEYRVQLLKETFKSSYPLSIYNGTKKKQEWLNTTCLELSQSVSVDPLGMRSNEADCCTLLSWEDQCDQAVGQSYVPEQRHTSVQYQWSPTTSLSPNLSSRCKPPVKSVTVAPASGHQSRSQWSLLSSVLK